MPERVSGFWSGTAAIWQIRTMRAEERLKQLTASETSESPPQPGATAAPEGQAATILPTMGQAPGPWWRRLLGLTRPGPPKTF